MTKTTLALASAAVISTTLLIVLGSISTSPKQITDTPQQETSEEPKNNEPTTEQPDPEEMGQVKLESADAPAPQPSTTQTNNTTPDSSNKDLVAFVVWHNSIYVPLLQSTLGTETRCQEQNEQFVKYGNLFEGTTYDPHFELWDLTLCEQAPIDIEDLRMKLITKTTPQMFKEWSRLESEKLQMSSLSGAKRAEGRRLDADPLSIIFDDATKYRDIASSRATEANIEWGRVIKENDL